MRMNISLPDDLKRRMDEEPDVNWSALACRAFETKLGELAAAKKEKQMADVVTRLRASKLRAKSDAAARGYQLGAQWATDTAEAEELDRLEAAVEQSRPHGMFAGESVYSDGECVYFAIGDTQDRGEAEDFWDSLGVESQDQTSTDFMEGFVEGALKVWGDVKDQL